MAIVSWSGPARLSARDAATASTAHGAVVGSAAPSSTSKKWNLAGSTASSSASPCRARVLGSRRAVKSVESVARSDRLVVLDAGLDVGPRRVDPEARVRVGAELLEDVDWTSIRGRSRRASAASSKASGRMPSTTGPAGAGRRAGVERDACCPKRTVASSSDASTRFIDGEPMKAGDEDVARPRVELLRRVDLHDAPVAHHGDALAERHRLGLVVRDVDGRHAEAARGAPRARRACRRGASRRGSKRLVHQERPRLAHDRAAHRDALPLAARQLRRPAVEQLGRGRAARRPRRCAAAPRPSAPCAP